MIDFEERAGLIIASGGYYDRHQHAKALRQLAADVLEEAAKECDRMAATLTRDDTWERAYSDCCEDNATSLRARATAIKDGKQ
jgi:hypothetical protein